MASHGPGRGRKGDDAAASVGAQGLRLDWLRTLAARGGQRLARAHLRHRPAEAAPGALHCFVIDASRSMRSAGQLERAKGLLAALMQAAARRGGRVALVCFSGTGAQVRVRPGRPGAWREAWAAPIESGGGTPVLEALRCASALLAGHARRHPGDARCLWLLTDARVRERPARPAAAERIHLIDFDEGPRAIGRARAWVQDWRASGHAGHALASELL